MTKVKHILLLIFCIFSICSLKADESIWQPQDLMQLKSIRDIQVSPDGQSVLFVVTEATENYVSNIYRTFINEPTKNVPLIDSLSFSFRPRWSPNGQLIAFLAGQQGYPQLYLVDKEGKNRRELTHVKQNVQSFCWSPDGNKIAVVIRESMPLNTQQLPLSYTLGKEHQAINRLGVIDLQANENNFKSYTNDRYCVRGIGDYGLDNEEFSWSPDGQFIVFAYSPSCGLDDYYLDSSLALLELKTGQICPLKKYAQHESSPRYSPNGQWISYLASEPPAYALNKRVHLRSSDTSKHVELAPTFNKGCLLDSPVLLGWLPDGAGVLVFEPHHSKYRLNFLPLDGKAPQEFDMQDWMIQKPCLSSNGKKLGFIGQSLNQPPEAYVTPLDSFKPLQISQVNTYFDTFPSFKHEIIRWKSVDGLEIEGLLTYPPDYQKGKSYPLILMVHGGPMHFFDQSFTGSPSFYTTALFAQDGYVVLRPNPRGSTGYGKHFRCLNYGDWGGKDFADLMTGVDTLINKGIADPDRLGVMGWSYGGYMTAWIISQTSRFKAAIAGAGISNLLSFSGTSNLYRFVSDYFGEFSQNPQIYQQRSPIYFAHQVQTPCLLLHGAADDKVPPTQSQEFYQALKRNNKPVKMIFYPEMGHGFNNPKILKEMMQENLSWFRVHLKVPFSKENFLSCPKKDSNLYCPLTCHLAIIAHRVKCKNLAK